MDVNWIEAGIGLLNVLVTGILGFVVFRAGRNVVRLEQDRAIKEAWIAIDQIALGNDEHLRTLDRMFHPDKEHESDADKRKRWLAHMVLNPLEAAWSSARKQHMPDGTLGSSEGAMRNLLRDPMVAEMMQTVVYGNDFKQRCRQILAEIERENRIAKGSSAPNPVPVAMAAGADGA